MRACPVAQAPGHREPIDPAFRSAPGSSAVGGCHNARAGEVRDGNAVKTWTARPSSATTCLCLRAYSSGVGGRQPPSAGYRLQDDLNASVTSLGVGCVVQHVPCARPLILRPQPSPRGVQKRTVVRSGCCYRGRHDRMQGWSAFAGRCKPLPHGSDPCGQRSGWCAISLSMSAVEGCSI